MYKLVIGKIVYIYDNRKDAQQAYYEAVFDRGITDVELTYYD